MQKPFSFDEIAGAINVEIMKIQAENINTTKKEMYEKLLNSHIQKYAKVEDVLPTFEEFKKYIKQKNFKIPD